MKKLKFRRALPLIVMACIAAAAVIFVICRGNITVDMLLSYTPRSKLLAAVVIILLYALKSQTVIILYAVIATATGMLFDLPYALLVNAIGSAVCISVPYFMGRTSDGVLVEGIFKKSARLRQVYEQNKDDLFLASLLLRVLNLSNDLLGVFFGSLKAPYPQYLASSFLGILPAMVLYTVIGQDWNPLSPPVLAAAAVEVLGVAAAFIVLHVQRKKRKERQARNEK